MSSCRFCKRKLAMATNNSAIASEVHNLRRAQLCFIALVVKEKPNTLRHSPWRSCHDMQRQSERERADANDEMFELLP